MSDNLSLDEGSSLIGTVVELVDDSRAILAGSRGIVRSVTVNKAGLTNLHLQITNTVCNYDYRSPKEGNSWDDTNMLSTCKGTFPTKEGYMVLSKKVIGVKPTTHEYTLINNQSDRRMLLR